MSERVFWDKEDIELLQRYLAESNYVLSEPNRADFRLITKTTCIDDGVSEHLQYPIHFYFLSKLRVMLYYHKLKDKCKVYCLYDPNSLQGIIDTIKSTEKDAYVFHRASTDTGMRYTTATT